MPNRFTKYWYKDEPSVARACLYNLRDADLRPGGKILRGQIVVGLCGYSVAEKDLDGFSGRAAEYLPNRCVQWYGSFLTCMALPDFPAGPSVGRKRSLLRHKQYVVAELPAAADIARGRKEGLHLLRSPDGRFLANLEIFTVPGRTPKYKRATLL